jgi:uncharacterized protein (TIGR02300 family)
MDRSERGAKHICPECASKYYDLNKKVITCPTCGAKPIVVKVRRVARPVEKAARTKFGRYP